MDRSTTARLLLAWALALSAAALPANSGERSVAPAQADERRAPATSPKVSLGLPSRTPEGLLKIAVSLSGGQRAQVARLVSRLTYPSRALTFVRLEKSALLEGDEFVEAVAQESTSKGMPAGESALEVRVSSKRPGVTVYDGTLAVLVFKVDPQAADASSTPKGSEPAVAVKHEMTFYRDGSAESAPPSAVTSEQVTISLAEQTASVFSCFFHMH